MVDISVYTSYANSYICPKDGIIVMFVNNGDTNHGAIGLKEGVDILRNYGNAGLSISSIPVRKGQGVCVTYNIGTGNSFHYYPFN